jgi:phage terminase small subunit
MDKSLKAPGYLAAPTRAWWESVVGAWTLEPHHVRLLTLAAEAWDRGQQARALLAKEGLTTGTKGGGLRPHPAVRIEGDCRIQFARLVRELDLDVDGPAEARRPPSLRSIAR